MEIKYFSYSGASLGSSKTALHMGQISSSSTDPSNLDTSYPILKGFSPREISFWKYQKVRWLKYFYRKHHFQKIRHMTVTSLLHQLPCLPSVGSWFLSRKCIFLFRTKCAGSLNVDRIHIWDVWAVDLAWHSTSMYITLYKQQWVYSTVQCTMSCNNCHYHTTSTDLSCQIWPL